MIESSKYSRELKNAIGSDQKPTWWILLFATLVLPNAIALLMNVWTGSAYQLSVGVALAVLVVVQLAFGSILLRQESRNRSPASILIDAHEDEIEKQTAKAELKRRTEAFRLVRQAFERLSQVPCTASLNPNEKGWYEKAFCGGLTPIIKPLIENIQLVLGVTSQQHSLQIFLCGGAAAFPTSSSAHLVCCCRHPECLAECGTVLTTEIHILPAYCFSSPRAFEQMASSTPQLFFKDGKEPEDLYFRRFASVPIFAPCTDEKVGTLILTSMQEEPFAQDVLETLAFFASIVSNFARSFQECVRSNYDLSVTAAEKNPLPPCKYDSLLKDIQSSPTAMLCFSMEKNKLQSANVPTEGTFDLEWQGNGNFCSTFDGTSLTLTVIPDKQSGNALVSWKMIRDSETIFFPVEGVGAPLEAGNRGGATLSLENGFALGYTKRDDEKSDRILKIPGSIFYVGIAPPERGSDQAATTAAAKK